MIDHIGRHDILPPAAEATGTIHADHRQALPLGHVFYISVMPIFIRSLEEWNRDTVKGPQTDEGQEYEDDACPGDRPSVSLISHQLSAINPQTCI